MTVVILDDNASKVDASISIRSKVTTIFMPIKFLQTHAICIRCL